MGHYFLEWLVEMVSVLWRADNRPEARRFTLGCALFVLAIAAGVVLIFRWY